MFDDLLVNAQTRSQIAGYLKKPSHGLLVCGTQGSGANYLAKRLAAELLGVKPDKLATQPHFIGVELPQDKKEIPIEAIREVIQKMALKVPSAKDVKRVVMIKDAELLSQPAQNTLLKVLEEPPVGTIFVLTSEAPSQLAPTILSRVQKILVRPVSLAATVDFYQNRYKAADINSAWQLSQGAPGLLDTLLNESSAHPLKQAVDQAKEILRGSTYERLLQLDKLSKDTVQFQAVLSALNRVLAALHHAALLKGGRQTKLLSARKQVAQAQSDLAANVSPKLVATSLALHLPTLF